jgi:ferritin-like metal-binding protein YciE
MNDTTTGSASLRYDSLADVTVEDERHALQAYVSDVLAFERHIKEPIARQRQFDAATMCTDVTRTIARIELMTDVHIRALEEQLQQLGGSAAGPVKSVVATVLGAGAAAIDGLRKAKVSKSLRDDYAALSLAAISYTMLHTAALGFGDGSTAALAKRHLDDVAEVAAEIKRIMPAVVLQELLDNGVDLAAPDVQQPARDTP